MAVDSLLRFSNAQVVGGAATVVSTDVVDLSPGGASGAIPQLFGLQGRDLGPGDDLAVMFTVDAAGTSDVTFNLIESAAAAMTSPTIIGSSGLVVAAQLTAGRNPIVVKINSSIVKTLATGQRFFAVQYVTGAGSGITVSAHMIRGDVNFAKYYNSAYTVVV